MNNEIINWKTVRDYIAERCEDWAVSEGDMNVHVMNGGYNDTFELYCGGDFCITVTFSGCECDCIYMQWEVATDEGGTIKKRCVCLIDSISDEHDAITLESVWKIASRYLRRTWDSAKEHVAAQEYVALNIA